VVGDARGVVGRLAETGGPASGDEHAIANAPTAIAAATAGPTRLCLACFIACSTVLIHPQGLRGVQAWHRSGEPPRALCHGLRQASDSPRERYAGHHGSR
jgi:hypothetical protein